MYGFHGLQTRAVAFENAHRIRATPFRKAEVRCANWDILNSMQLFDNMMVKQLRRETSDLDFALVPTAPTTW